MVVENSPRMPNINGSVIGPGMSAVIPKIGTQNDMTTPLLGLYNHQGRLVKIKENYLFNTLNCIGLDLYIQELVLNMRAVQTYP